MLPPTGLLLLLGSIATVAAASDEKPCTIRQGSKYWDLNTLSAKHDYEIRTRHNHMFSINVCKATTQDTFGLKGIDVNLVAGIIRRDHGDFSIGYVNTSLIVDPETSNVKMFLTEGSKCNSKAEPESKATASTAIEFVCDRTVFGPGKPRLVAQLPPQNDDVACAFFVEWRTHFACPKNEGGGFWGFISTLFIVIIIVTVAYLIFGTLYNRFALGLRGADQIPQFSVASARYHAANAWDWCKDNLMKQGYNRLPRDRFGPEGGERSLFGGRNGVSLHPEDGTGEPLIGTPPPPPKKTPLTSPLNPVSHQVQFARAGETGEESTNAPAQSLSEANASLFAGSGNPGGAGGFVRPTRKASATTATTNPVSHQSQVQSALRAGAGAALANLDSTPPPPRTFVSSNGSGVAPPPRTFSSSASPPAPGNQELLPTQPAGGLPPQTPRPFQVGDDDEDDEQSRELVDVGTSKPTS